MKSVCSFKLLQVTSSYLSYFKLLQITLQLTDGNFQLFKSTERYYCTGIQPARIASERNSLGIWKYWRIFGAKNAPWGDSRKENNTSTEISTLGGLHARQEPRPSPRFARLSSFGVGRPRPPKCPEGIAKNAILAPNFSLLSIKKSPERRSPPKPQSLHRSASLPHCD